MFFTSSLFSGVIVTVMSVFSFTALPIIKEESDSEISISSPALKPFLSSHFFGR